MNKKVLIVDDSATDRAVLSQMLIEAGFDVVEAQSGEQALFSVAQDRPDLILMDVVMPGLNGFQATREISRKDKQIPIIIVTSKNGETDRLWGLRQGAAAYLVKPVNKTVLLAEVKKVLAL